MRPRITNLDDLVRYLRGRGWYQARISGGHRVFKREDRPDVLVVPVGKSANPKVIKWIMALEEKGAKHNRRTA